MNKQLPQYERSLPIALLKSREAVLKEFIPVLRANHLSAEQWRVIRLLSEAGKLATNEVAQQCFLLTSSLSRIVTTLVKRELITRTISSDDQRVFILAISPTGQQLVEQVKPHSIKSYQRIANCFGEDKLDLLYGLLENLVKSIETINGKKPHKN